MNQTTDGITLITLERKRQIEKKGFTSEHDDKHVNGELSAAAGSYTALASIQTNRQVHMQVKPSEMDPHPLWPWDESTWKPSDDVVRNLVRAGALIAAEIDRVQRLQPAKPE